MKLLSRYIITRLSLMSAYALFAILSLYSFIDLLSEIGIVGQNYTMAVALQYIALQMPARAYQLMPLATLIGGLIALNQLVSSSEWAVIKTSGWSSKRLIGTILQFGAIFAVFTILLGEWIAPELSRRGDAIKTLARSQQTTLVHNGVWIKQPNSMINIGAMLPDKTLLDVKIWQFNDQYQLTESVYVKQARFANGQWQLNQVQSSELADKQIRTSQQGQRTWQFNIQSNMLDVLMVKPEQMSFINLTQYIGYLKDNKQQTEAYDVAWWNKLVYPIATMVMALVALAFTPNSGRHGNLGLKLFGGICLGLLFFFTGRLFGFTTQLYRVPAFVSAVLPTLGFALWAMWLIVKQERR
ncbi:LPS export ABC transporter permease LptG [Kingella kingae]|uniref:LPS export ABC transporter permease LptG n=1 Tax=Kingella kingae TaxID=504 RepID=UPI00040E7E23|nr:LPS export ABC transporter permease LptG [Kingella kingae]MBD3613975.1 LPS export ABC transporter permease LptG [Kingella kingae]MBD3632305.1 LPS export ABC transporter permease LptG [Kingella kingae]MBD3659603.1 LPS export ABC transporter permease LptG [Kingella kingae]MDK4587373.1 LPS export ABC transporter permease LptG [Kingella kingae]MDK4605512.1 LPS export ABC transporter permease LptG [Kingella kingae]